MLIMVDMLVIIESFSIGFFLAATLLIFYNIIKFFKGMKKPPIWIYLLIGFILITLHGILSTLPIEVFPRTALALLRLSGNFAIFFGAFKLYRSYSAKIKYDKTLKP